MDNQPLPVKICIMLAFVSIHSWASAGYALGCLRSCHWIIMIPAIASYFPRTCIWKKEATSTLWSCLFLAYDIILFKKVFIKLFWNYFFIKWNDSCFCFHTLWIFISWMCGKISRYNNSPINAHACSCYMLFIVISVLHTDNPT